VDRSGYFQWLLALVFPPICPICQNSLGDGERDALICGACEQDVQTIQPPYCAGCGLPFPSQETDIHLCSRCLTEQYYFEIHRSCGLYEGTLREGIHRLKYLGDFPTVRYFGNLLYSTFQQCFQDWPVDVALPVPLHPRRLRERGFNQALLLARELSKKTKIPLRAKALRKIKYTPTQTGLTGRQRKKNLKGAFQVAQKESLTGRSVLLIDDVYTTGATASECARVLQKAGAQRVAVLTLARTT